MFSKTPGGDIPPEGVKASDGTQGPDPQSAEGEQTRQTNHELSESEDLQTPARSDPARDNFIPAPQTPNPKPVKPRRLDYWGQFGLGIKAKVPTPPAPEGAAEVAPEVGPEPAPEVAPEAELGVAPEVSLQAGPEVALASSAPDSPDQIPSDQISPDQNAADLAPTGQADSGSPAGEGQTQTQAQPQAQDAKKALKSAKGLAYSSFGPAIKPQKPKTKAQKLSDEKSSPEEPDLAAVSPEAPVASKGLGENVESIQEPAPGAETKPILGETPGPSEPMIEQKPMLGPSPSIAEGLKLDTLKFESYPETILGDLRSSDSPAETITQSPAAEVKNVDSPKARINLSGLEAPDFGPTDESPGEPQALAEAVAKSVAEAVPEAVAESVPESVAESGGLPQADESGPAQPPLAAEDPDLRAGRPNFLTSTRFSDFDLPSEIMLGIEAAGFDCTTPIQAQVIPVALEGLDIAGQAQTGTGKTTAFLVPLLSRLIRKPSMNPGLPRALVITPTRELADQIYKDAKLLASATNISLALIMGGLEYREQSNALQDGADVVICTPGRLIDYLHQGIFVPSAVEVAVVDEADRLLDMGFIKDLKTILSKLPPFTHRQTMLFSATLDDRVLELTYQYMNPPQYITAEPDPQSKIQIDQTLYHVSNSEKLPLLIGLLRHQEHSRVIIFCNTRSRVDWLTKKLTLNGFQAEGITGDLPQAKRLKLMQAFKDQRLQIMVATDVASRGIHVEDVSHVYNYDLPQDSENYIHRIGRTARAGKTGKAISFACEEHVYHLEAIENLLGEKIPVVWPDEALFDKDQAGDVKFRERERPRDLGRDRDRDRDRDRERPSSRPSRPAPIPFQERSERRIPVQVNRPGGIFGISPRFPVQNGAVDVRQVLSWKPSEFTAEDAKISRARSAKPARQGAYAQNGSAQDSPYDSYGPEPRPEPRPEAKRPEPTGAPHPYAPDPEPPLYFGPEPEGLDDSYDDRALANDRDNRRRKRPRGKLGRDFDGPNGFHDAPAQGPKKSDRRAQKEALRKTLI
ncbi:MAG: DEAD/DEAH box helicase [Deltaproteobacteria bacterium]|jgi:ATP-dependent RNA helicase RhlB|nr:DEAD/DEAH box helicase [Deltaproteobacteria bacterium]